MTHQQRAPIALLLLLVLVAMLAGCDPVTSSQGPSTPPPSNIPEEGVNVYFVFEATDVDGRAISKRISVTITGFQEDGQFARIIAEDGRVVKGPLDIPPRSTPYVHRTSLGPGIDHAVASAVMPGVDGQSLICHIVGPDGQELSGTRVRATIVGGPNGLGVAQILTCGPVSYRSFKKS